MPPSLAAILSRLDQTLATIFPAHSACLSLAAVVDPEAYLARSPVAPPVVLAESELATLAAYTLPKRRGQWLTGRLCAKEAIGCYLRRFRPQSPLPASRDLVISNFVDGRPFIDSPLAAVSGLDLSITHSGDHAAALVAAAACGIDIQEDAPTLLRVRDRFCQGHEGQILERALPGLAPIPRLNLLWTAKEAARKAVGRERMPGFLELVLHRCQPIAGDCIVLTLRRESGPPHPSQDLTIVATRFDQFSLSAVLSTEGNAHA